MTDKPASQFSPALLSDREASILRRALIKYAKDCDARFQSAGSPQDAYSAAKEAETSRGLVERIVKAESANVRTIASSFRPKAS